MINYKKIVYLFITIFMLTYSNIGFCNFYVSYGHYISFSQYESIKENLTKNDVIDLLGIPSFKSNSRHKWYYYFSDIPNDGQTLPVIRFLIISFDEKKVVNFVDFFY